jgi:guanylate kinase
MTNSVNRNRPTADEIADMADSGRDISEFFTNQGTMKPPFKRIIVDVAPDVFQELEQLADGLRGRSQTVIRSRLEQRRRMTQAIGKLKFHRAVIESHLRQALNQQPRFSNSWPNATNHDAQLAVYEEVAR